MVIESNENDNIRVEFTILHAEDIKTENDHSYINYSQLPKETETVLSIQSEIGSESVQDIDVKIESATTYPNVNRHFKNLMAIRSELVRSKCRNQTKQVLKSKNTYWLIEENIAYCPTFKSASSTWFNYLVQLTNRPEKEKEEVRTKYIGLVQQLRHLGAINPNASKWTSHIMQLPNNFQEKTATTYFIGFLVVRHPFTRLVSAYRDKLERNNLADPYYYNRFGQHFVEKYREHASKVLGIDYFTEKNNFGTPIEVQNNGRPNADLPTFWEFSQSVIDRYKIDEHWAPINEYCSICDIVSLKAYQYILKYEKLDKEEDEFLKHVKWNKILKKRLTINVNYHPNELSDMELTKVYFSCLSKDQIISLYKVYELDFVAFNYTFEMNDLRFPGHFK
jgi:hypothetical protein